MYAELNRRGFLLAAGAALTSLHGFAAEPGCVLAPEQEEGPYYVSGATFRRTVTEGRPGVPLTLRIQLVDAKKCTPLTNAAIDIWHCDADGVYSGFTANDPNGPPGRGGPPPRDGDGRGRGMFPPPGGGPPPFGLRGPGPGRGPRKIDETRFLRGVQLTNRSGAVEFGTVYPGWYSGRAIHVHLKVHLGGKEAAEKYAGGHVAHTGQLFFPEDLTERIAKLQPYAKRLEIHRTTQDEDGVYQDQHGAATMLRMERIAARSDAEGFIATVTLAVDPEATPAPVDFGPGRSGPPPFDR